MTPGDLRKIESARLGIIVLRTILKRNRLILGEKRATEILADLDAIIERRKEKIKACKT